MRPFVVAVDSREQIPYKWGPSVPCQTQTLQAGDYSVVGLENIVAVERKSHADLHGCLTTGRDRFERSLHRLAALRYPLVVIEASMADLWEPFTYVASGGVETQSRVTPLVVVNSILSWQTRYRMAFTLCGDRRGGARITLQHLSLVWRMERDGLTGDHAGVELV